MGTKVIWAIADDRKIEGEFAIANSLRYPEGVLEESGGVQAFAKTPREVGMMTGSGDNRTGG